MRALGPAAKPEFRLNAESIGNYLRQTLRGLELAWKASPSLGILIAALTALSAALPPGLAYIGKMIIDAVVAKSSDLAMELVLLEFGLIAAITITQRSLFLARTLLGNRLGISVNSTILEKAIALDLSQIENSEFYDKLNRARQEASSRSLQMVTDTFQFFQNLLTLFAYVALLFSFSSWAVLALVLASLPATIAEMRFSSIGFKLYNWRSSDRRKLSYMEYVLANDTYAKEVRVLNLGPRFLARYKELAEGFFREDSDLSKRRTGWMILLSLLSSGAFYGCYLVIAIEAARGQITLGNLTLYVVVFRQGQQAFQSCLTAIGGTFEHNLYLSNLFEFLAIPTASSDHKTQTTSAPPSAASGLSFEDVSFRYPGRDGWALRHIDLKIPKGQSLAVVGANGAGKSTLIKLLCRLYDPTEGRITLDGRDLRDWDRQALQHRISLVFQDFNKYQMSFRENVGVGFEKAMNDESHVLRAIDRGGAGELLQEFPKGLDTSLGTWFKDGQELSGGQWQKVAVSRAFMREEADILILDEPTAALDAEAESRAFQKFKELTAEKTSLIISHRFPVARLADQILVIEHGQIQEAGSHEQLMASHGRYAQLFTLQAQGYNP